MEDFKPSQDYLHMWEDAKKLKSIERMDAIFNQLLFEVGGYDPNRIAITAEAATKAAEARNDRDAGKGGIKI
jgi:hypothetical protein